MRAVKNSPPFRYIKNAGWMFLARIGGMIISFLATILVTRHLGPSNYGELSYAVSFVGFFGFIAALGLDQVLYRDLLLHPEKKDLYLGTSITLRLSGSFLTIASCILCALLFSQRDISFWLICIVSLSFIFNSFILLSYEFQASVLQKYPSLLSLCILIILNISKLAVTFFDKGVFYLAAIVVLEPLLYASGYLFLRTKIFGPLKRLQFDRAIAITVLKDSIPLMFASAFFAIYAGIDQIMIKNMLDSRSVGLYSSTVLVVEAWFFIPSIIISSLFPAIVNAKKVSEKLYYTRIKNLTILLSGLSILISILMFFFAQSIIQIVFGKDFIESYPLLRIYVWGLLGNSLSAVLQQILIIENYSVLISIMTFLGMITNVILNYFFIPKYGISGAAIATLISYVTPFLCLLFSKKTRRLIFLTVTS